MADEVTPRGAHGEWTTTPSGAQAHVLWRGNPSDEERQAVEELIEAAFARMEGGPNDGE